MQYITYGNGQTVKQMVQSTILSLQTIAANETQRIEQIRNRQKQLVAVDNVIPQYKCEVINKKINVVNGY